MTCVISAADWLWFCTRRTGTGDVRGRAPQCIRTRGSRKPPHRNSFDIGLRWVRDRRERSKPTDELAAGRNVRPRLGSWAGNRRAEGSPARLDAPNCSTCAAAHRSGKTTWWAWPVTLSRFSSSCSSTEESEAERDRDPDLGDDWDIGEEEKDQSELCAKLQEYRAIARERDEWKKKFEDTQMAFKKEEIKRLKELYMARISQVSPEVLATMNSSEGSREHIPGRRHRSCAHRESPRLLIRHHSLLQTRGIWYRILQTPIWLPSFKSHSIRRQSSVERDQQDHWPDAGQGRPFPTPWSFLKWLGANTSSHSTNGDYTWRNDSEILRGWHRE